MQFTSQMTNCTPNVSTVRCCLHQWYEIQGVWMCFYMHALTGDDVLRNGDVNNNETEITK